MLLIFRLFRLHQQSRYEEAETLLRDMLDIQKRIRGDEHALTLRAMHHLAYVLRNRQETDEKLAQILNETGRGDEAEAVRREFLRVVSLPPGDVATATDYA